MAEFESGYSSVNSSECEFDCGMNEAKSFYQVVDLVGLVGKFDGTTSNGEVGEHRGDRNLKEKNYSHERYFSIRRCIRRCRWA